MGENHASHNSHASIPLSLNHLKKNHYRQLRGAARMIDKTIVFHAAFIIEK